MLRHWKDYHNTNEEIVTEDDQEKEDIGNQDSRCHVQVDTVGPVGRSEYFCSKCSRKFLSNYQLSQHLPSCWSICRCGFNSYAVRPSLHHMMNCAAINTSQLWFRRGREVVRPWTIPCPGCPFETDREAQLIDHLRQNSWHSDVLEANPVYMKRLQLLFCFFVLHVKKKMCTFPKSHLETSFCDLLNSYFHKQYLFSADIYTRVLFVCGTCFAVGRSQRYYILYTFI